MAKDNEIKKPKLLIVEGDHDYLFFRAWLSKRNLNNQIQVMQMEGKDKLPVQLRTLTKQSAYIHGEVETIVIARDADRYPDRAFQSVCSALGNAGLARPRQPYSFVDGSNPRIAVMIIPSFEQQGAIEELVFQTVQDDPIIHNVQEFIQQVVRILPQKAPEVEFLYRHFGPPEHRLGKAHVHAFLATFDQPDRDLGIAALAGVWNFDHQALNQIRAILQQM